jgi:hypothetical protein
MNPTIRQFLLALFAAVCAAAYPSSGSMDVTGPSDFVGTYTLTGHNQPTETGYGGGFEGNITANNQNYIQMLYCVDFSNDVTIPDWNIGVNLTPIAAGTQFQDDTRFGDVTSWRPVQDYLPASDPSLSSSVITTINNATALERYQMAAYLVSNYAFFNNALPTSTEVYSDATDRGIQSAIWAILDPTSDLYVPPTSLSDSGDINYWLSKAAQWLPTANTTAGEQLLSRFVIVSDAKIAGSLNPTQVGIQEFITPVAPVPEPGFYGVVGIGLAGLLWMARRKGQQLESNNKSSA